VESAGDLVGVAVELASCMQLGEDDFQGGAVELRVGIYGDAATVVPDGNHISIEQTDVYPITEPCLGFIDAVVHHLPDEVMKPGLAGRADVHAGALPDRLESFEDLDRSGVVALTLQLRQVIFSFRFQRI